MPPGNAEALFKRKTPALMSVVPVYVLLPARVSVPMPFLVSVPPELVRAEA